MLERELHVNNRLGLHARAAAKLVQLLSGFKSQATLTGRGLAGRLTAWLANDILASGRVPFLHVSHENPRAKGLYERLGFRVRRDIPFWSLRRP